MPTTALQPTTRYGIFTVVCSVEVFNGTFPISLSRNITTIFYKHYSIRKK